MNETEAEPRPSQHADGERDRPLIICVFGMAKSASRLIANMVAVLPPDPFPRSWKDPSWRRRKAYEIFPELVDEAPEGAVFHVQSLPTEQNLTTIREIGAKVVVTVRHPADQVTALGCFQRRRAIERGEDRVPPPDGIVAAAIEAGGLRRWLEWAAAWIEAAPSVGGYIVRYEDWLNTPTETVAAIGRHTLPEPPEHERVKKAVERLRLREGKRQQTLNSDYYPAGWTAEIGVWRRYFTENDYIAYKAVVSGFLASDANAQHLLAYYPDALTAVDS